MGVEERRTFLERSLADLEDEHAAGDLTDADHARLKADYERRLAVLEGKAKPAARRAPPRRSPVGRAGTAVGVAAFAVLAGVLVAQASGRRDAGDTITGADLGSDAATSATATTLPEALARCFDVSGSAAFDCYIAYTRANPEDPDGFLYFGLYSVNHGLESASPELLSGGETFLRRALELDPEHLAARVNLAVLLERTNRDDEARAELAHLDGVDLPSDLRPLYDFVQRNLDDAGSTTTTTTTGG